MSILTIALWSVGVASYIIFVALLIGIGMIKLTDYNNDIKDSIIGIVCVIIGFSMIVFVGIYNAERNKEILVNPNQTIESVQ